MRARPHHSIAFRSLQTMLTRVGSAQLYCQNLCLFAKLFIEHKYMFFDVRPRPNSLLTPQLMRRFTGRGLHLLPLDGGDKQARMGARLLLQSTRTRLCPYRDALT